MLRIVLDTGKLNLQANTPVLKVSERDQDGYITVSTSRGDVRTKTVVHATVCPNLSMIQNGALKADDPHSQEPMGLSPAPRIF